MFFFFFILSPWKLMLKDFKTTREVIGEVIWVHLAELLFVMISNKSLWEDIWRISLGEENWSFKIFVQLPAY